MITSLSKCPLCEVIERGAPLLFVRDEHAVALLHDDWAVRGHAMVVSTRHVENASDLDRDALSSFMRTVGDVESALLEVVGADRAIWMKLGLAVPHFHLHIYPVKTTASRADVFAAINMQVRDEPDDAGKEQLLGELRAEVARRRAQ